MKTNFTIFTILLLFTNLTSQVFVKIDAVGNNDGISWNDAYINLQDAFDNANTGEQIWIAEGIYKPSNNISPDSNWFEVTQGLEIYGGFIGTEISLDQRDWNTNITELSGDINGDDIIDDFDNFRADNVVHVLWFLGGYNILDGVVITAGQTSLDPEPPPTITTLTVEKLAPYSGGGCYVTSNSEIRNCIFRECSGKYGSAVQADSADIFILEDCIFENNKSGLGAAGVRWGNNPIVQRCLFENNSASIGAGLGLKYTDGLVRDCTFQNNKAGYSGGGLYISQDSFLKLDSSLVEVRNCQFTDNRSGAVGGGLSFYNTTAKSEILVDSCIFLENSSTNGYGAGGVYVEDYVNVDIGMEPNRTAVFSNCLFKKNTSLQGGGAYILSNNHLNLELSNCDFEENYAYITGGGLILKKTNALIEDCLFKKNGIPPDLQLAPVGGGIYMANDGGFTTSLSTIVEIKRCDFIENEASDGGGIYLSNHKNNYQSYIDSCYFYKNQAYLSGSGGAISLINESSTDNNTLTTIVTNNHFESNYCDEGGGIYIFSKSDTTDIFIEKNIFEKNRSALFIKKVFDATTEITAVISKNIFSENTGGSPVLEFENTDSVLLENTLISENHSNSSIRNRGYLRMVNVTMANNEGGLNQPYVGVTEMQNTILANNLLGNYSGGTNSQIVSKGGNLSDDISVSNFLLGHMGYEDYNNTSPNLEMDYFLKPISICINAGNPNNLFSMTDLVEANRIQGGQVDIGAYESSYLMVENKNLKEKSKIDIYPNPFIDYVVISDVEHTKGIRLIDSCGKTIQRFAIQKKLSIPIELVEGVYFLELDEGTQKYIYKLAKINK